MNKKIIISLSVLSVIVALYFLNSSSQNNYRSPSQKLMNIQEKNLSTGSYNIALGNDAGKQVTTGSYNVLVGSYQGNNVDLDIRTTSNHVVLSD